MANIKDIVAGMTYVKIMVDNSELAKGLSKSEALLNRFGDVCASVGSKMVATGVMLSAPFVNAVSVFAQFDDQMRMTKAVTTATADEFALLTKRAKQIGRDTAFSASQAAAGMTALGRMGFSPEQIDRSTSSVVDLSLATGTELAQAADIAANSLRMFKLQATDMTRVADVLTATANGSAQTLVDLFEALKMAGPQAAAAEESIEDVSAAIGVMANVGIKGSLAGTALRRAYVNMANGKIQEYLRQYNIQTVDTVGNLRKMKDIIVDVGRAMQSMGTAQKMTFAEDIFDMRGSFVGLTLGSDVEGLQKFIRKLEQESAGTAKRTREEMEGGIGGALRNLSSAWEDVNHSLAESINGTLVTLLKTFAKIAKAVSEWIAKNADLVRSLAIGAGVMTSMGAVLVAVGIGIGGVCSAAGALHSAFAKVMSPVTKYHKAMIELANVNVGLASSTTRVTTALQAKIHADGASLAVVHAQKEATAAQIALTNARTPAERAAANASLLAAEANLKQAMATEQSAQAQLASISAAEASRMASSKLSLAKQHDALATQAADAAKIASAKKLALSNAEVAMAQRSAELGMAKMTGIGVAQAKANMELARTNHNVAASDYEVAKAEATKAATMQAALAPQTLQLAGAKKILDVLGLQETSTNLARASFVAMNNAMAGAAAKKAIMAWTAGLKSINIMSSMMAMNAKVATAMNSILTASLYRQGVVSALTATKNYLAATSISALGFASRVAVGGVMLMSKALTVLAAHPVIAVLSGITAGLVALSLVAGRAARKIYDEAMRAAEAVKGIDSRFEYRQNESNQSQRDFDRIRSLQKIAEQSKLTAEQIQEAEALIARLKQQGFSDVASLDSAAGTITSAADAMEKFNQALHERQVLAMREKVRGKHDLLQKLSHEAGQLTTKWYHVDKPTRNEHIARLYEKIIEIDQSLQDDMRELNSLRNQPIEQRHEEEAQRITVSAEAAADAQKRLAEISKKIANDKLSDIEREIQGIQDLRDEYIKLLKTRLDFERGKSKPDKKVIAELETSLAKSGDLFKGMEAAAYESHYKGTFVDLDAMTIDFEEKRRRDNEGAKERSRLERLERGPAAVYVSALQQDLHNAYAKLDAATAAYKNMFATFSSVGSAGGQTLTEQEKKKLEIQKQLYDYTQERIDFLLGKLRETDADFQGKKQEINQASLGTFITSEVLNLVATSGPQEETARNTRATAANLAMLIDVVRRQEGLSFS